MLKLTWGRGQNIPEETEMWKSWIDSFALLHTHIHLCDVKGIPVARHQNLEIVNSMQDGEDG